MEDLAIFVIGGIVFFGAVLFLLNRLSAGIAVPKVLCLVLILVGGVVGIICKKWIKKYCF